MLRFIEIKSPPYTWIAIVGCSEGLLMAWIVSEPIVRRHGPASVQSARLGERVVGASVEHVVFVPGKDAHDRPHTMVVRQ